MEKININDTWYWGHEEDIAKLFDDNLSDIDWGLIATKITDNNLQEIIINFEVTNYVIDVNGNVYNKKTNRKLKPFISGPGYLKIELSINNKRHKYYIHRLVAETFIPNLENKPQVNHINRIKTDNRLNNLEWNTSSENTINGYKNGMSNKRKKVRVIKKSGLIREYNSVAEAAKALGLKRQNLYQHLIGAYKTYKNNEYFIRVHFIED